MEKPIKNPENNYNNRQKGNAKIRHRQKIILFLSDWENEWPKGAKGLAKICEVNPETIYYHFTSTEIREIYNEGLEERKKNSSGQRKRVYDSMLLTALEGNTSAQNSFLDRTEGKVTEKIEHGFDAATLNAILSALPVEYADAVKAQLSELTKKKI